MKKTVFVGRYQPSRAKVWRPFRSIHRAADVLGQSAALSIGRLVERLGLGARIVRLRFRREHLLSGGPRLESEVQAPVTCKSARSTVAVHVWLVRDGGRSTPEMGAAETIVEQAADDRRW